MDKMRKTIEENKKQYSDNYNSMSKERLLKIIATKMKTGFIGALYQFECIFGDLWGHGVSKEFLTEDEKKFRDMYYLVRNKILTNGNDQYRALENELEQYTIKWDRYQYKREEN